MNIKKFIITFLLVTFLFPSFANANDPRYNNKTFVSFSGSHGTQVEYFAANGLSYLWYPGNRRALAGRWKITNQQEMCFKYGTNTYNPVTDQRGGDWECQSISILKRYRVFSCSADKFNLSSLRIPYVLTKRPQDLGRIADRCSEEVYVEEGVLAQFGI